MSHHDEVIGDCPCGGRVLSGCDETPDGMHRPDPFCDTCWRDLEEIRRDFPNAIALSDYEEEK